MKRLNWSQVLLYIGILIFLVAGVLVLIMAIVLLIIFGFKSIHIRKRHLSL